MKVRPKLVMGLVMFLGVSAVAPLSTADDDWLVRLNQYRAIEKLKPVTQDERLTAGEVAHARYLVKNYAATFRETHRLGVDMHIEDPANQWYSYAGFVAGRASDVLIDVGTPSATWAIDGWIAAPFHRFPLLNPELRSVAYGSFCENGFCAGAINVQSDSLSSGLELRRRITSGEPITGDSEALGGGWGTHYANPILFPPEGAVVDLLSFSDEWPDPIKSCQGFIPPTGLPITIQTGWYLTPRITSGSLSADGKPVSACAFDANNFSSPDQLTQRMGRAGLKHSGAIVILPREPLRPGTSYAVAAVVDDKTYRWSFSTTGAAVFVK